MAKNDKPQAPPDPPEPPQAPPEEPMTEPQATPSQDPPGTPPEPPEEPKKEPEKVPEDHVLLLAPPGVTSCASGTGSYKVHKDGRVVVRQEHARALIVHHGFKKV